MTEEIRNIKSQRNKMAGKPTLYALALLTMLGAGSARAEDDPLESFNRGIFQVNNAVIDYLISPASAFFDAWLPDGLRRVGGNVYSNLTEPEFIVTNLLAGNTDDARASAGRFVVNSTIGLAGLYDPATGLGLNRRETEFGEALCLAGVPTAPYVMLPLAGPSNVWSATLLTGFIVGGWYLLSMISPLLATADLVLDLSASAASLRHASEQPDMAEQDPYALQKADYRRYLDQGCPGNASGDKPPVLSQK